MRLSIESLVLLLSALNASAFAMIIFCKKERDDNSSYIAVLLLLCALMLFDEFSRWTPDFFNNYPSFTYIFTFAWFLILPGIYLLLRHQTLGTGLRLMDLLHLIPLIGINTLENYYASNQVRIDKLTSYFVQPEPHTAKLFFAAQIIVYLWLTFRLFSFKPGEFGMPMLSRLHLWVKAILAIQIIYFMAIVAIIVAAEWGESYLRWLDTGKTYLFLLIVYGWLFYAYAYPQKLRYPFRSVSLWQEMLQKDGLSIQLKELIQAIADKKLYLNPELQVSDIALSIGVSGRRLTQLVNSELNATLPQLINLIRIKEMEQRMKQAEYKNYTLVGLATSVGFSSKSAFYRCFKHFTKETPTQYFNRLSPL